MTIDAPISELPNGISDHRTNVRTGSKYLKAELP